ncbi:DUF4190 domain-containing protein [Nocardia sp. NPDC127579]|uniref:DUF4190 domain-containing protein n=1 Tax=Nocardia sp. NPDC127579 TaxID=3345402 RepID=UPI0036434892
MSDTRTLLTDGRLLRQRKGTSLDDFYDLLGVSPSASEDLLRSEIAQAQRMWMKRTGLPDLERRQEAERNVQRLADAKAVLLDPGKRSEYDQRLADAQRPPASTTAVAPVQSFAPVPPPAPAPAWQPAPPAYQPPPQFAAPAPMPANTMVTPALILSCVGLVLCPIGMFSIAGLVLGVLARNQIARTGAEGQGKAILAIVLGGVGLVGFALVTLSRTLYI